MESSPLYVHDLVDSHKHSADMIADPDNNKALIKAIVMESSIAIHSIIIGFNLGTLPVDALETVKVLMIAFSFHQFFEGVSLGTAILQSSFNTYSKLIFGFLFSLTLPIGILIGMTSTSESENGTALLVAGLAGSVASGSLIYTGLIEMAAEDFSDPLLLLTPSVKAKMYVAMSIGAVFMAILAIWA